MPGTTKLIPVATARQVRSSRLIGEFSPHELRYPCRMSAPPHNDNSESPESKKRCASKPCGKLLGSLDSVVTRCPAKKSSSELALSPKMIRFSWHTGAVMPVQEPVHSLKWPAQIDIYPTAIWLQTRVCSGALHAWKTIPGQTQLPHLSKSKTRGLLAAPHPPLPQTRQNPKQDASAWSYPVKAGQIASIDWARAARVKFTALQHNLLRR